MMELLIRNKANVNDKNTYGYTPLYFANTSTIAQYLISNKANISAQNADGETPLHIAARQSNIDIIQLLMRNKANLHDQDHGGWIPFDHTCDDAIKRLLALGGEYHIADEE